MRRVYSPRWRLSCAECVGHSRTGRCTAPSRRAAAPPRTVGQVTNEWCGWREATERALYGPDDGFYTRPGGPGPAGHFRTSVHASRLYAGAVAALLRRVDAALGPSGRAGAGRCRRGARRAADRGAGRAARAEVAARLRPYAVERAARPEGLDPRIGWRAELPAPGSVTGLLFANEWLDNVPVDVVETDADGVPRRVLVRADGTERLGEPVDGADAEWLGPLVGPPLAPESRPARRPPPGCAPRSAGPGTPPGRGPSVRCAPGSPSPPTTRTNGATARPSARSPASATAGEVPPVPDGSCDITAHVALDACAGPSAGAADPARGAARPRGGRPAPAARPGRHRPGRVRTGAGRGRARRRS